ncbi:DUF1993 domain-containing protein [Deefgea tanakiae]|uniref:DUF1993 domain-containing protein n=1 Tax=Deefgea tanakiae TaxID=2865840 RepID=A0ABX8Z953_9NEIS|nr:DUF1993 domain-containing protein [Deefgea tanakiae]QZA79117.1 DUF1993 domain-containing protein [Deefgea tanakiae]
MPISMYSASVPVFKQMLLALADVLAKAEAHAKANGIDAETLLQARLAPDMFPLVRQVQIACDFAKSVPARLAGVEVPSYEDSEQNFAELQTRISNTLAVVEGFSAAQIDGSEDLEVVLRAGTPKEKKLNGQTYLLSYGLPQFFFHITTSYALLRHHGVEIGKRDYMGAY